MVTMMKRKVTMMKMTVTTDDGSSPGQGHGLRSHHLVVDSVVVA